MHTCIGKILDKSGAAFRRGMPETNRARWRVTALWCGRLWEPGATLASYLANLIMSESIADLFAKQLQDLKDQDVISQRKTERTLDRLHAMIEELKLLDCEQD